MFDVFQTKYNLIYFDLMVFFLTVKVGYDNVEFATLWEQGHTRAEISGGSTVNFINWVNRCME